MDQELCNQKVIRVPRPTKKQVVRQILADHIYDKILDRQLRDNKFKQEMIKEDGDFKHKMNKINPYRNVPGVYNPRVRLCDPSKDQLFEGYDKLTCEELVEQRDYKYVND